MRLVGWLSPYVEKKKLQTLHFPRLLSSCQSLILVLVPFCSSNVARYQAPAQNLVGDGMSTTAVTLLSNGELDTLALGQGDPGLLLANDENVALTGSEAVVNGILDVDNVEATIVTLTVGDDTDTTHVTTTGDHGDGTSVELDKVGDLAGGKVDLDSVVDLDQRVGVADAKREKMQISKEGSRW
jgi:hypothetical protein